MQADDDNEEDGGDGGDGDKSDGEDADEDGDGEDNGDNGEPIGESDAQLLALPLLYRSRPCCFPCRHYDEDEDYHDDGYCDGADYHYNEDSDEDYHYDKDEDEDYH